MSGVILMSSNGRLNIYNINFLYNFKFSRDNLDDIEDLMLLCNNINYTINYIEYCNGQGISKTTITNTGYSFIIKYFLIKDIAVSLEINKRYYEIIKLKIIEYYTNLDEELYVEFPITNINENCGVLETPHDRLVLYIDNYFLKSCLIVYDPEVIYSLLTQNNTIISSRNNFFFEFINSSDLKISFINRNINIYKIKYLGMNVLIKIKPTSERLNRYDFYSI